MPKPSLDPTIKFYDVELDGNTYHLAFDLGSLADAEVAINKEGGDVNLLRALDFSNLTLNAVRQLFGCAIRKAHPDVSYRDAKALVTMRTLYPISAALFAAWSESIGADEDSQKKAPPETTEIPQPDSAVSDSGETSGPLPDTTSV